MYLESKEWRDKANKAKYAAGQRCQVCYSTKKLQAHHRTYLRLGCEIPSDITVLCDECHGLFHHRMPEVRDPDLKAPPMKEVQAILDNPRFA